MKLTSKVDRLQYDINGEEMELTIEFNIDLEICDDDFFNKKRVFVVFNKNGKIVRFPNLGDNSYENPIKYIAMGKAVEEILTFEGDRVKNVYDKAMEIYKEFEAKEVALREETNYNKLNSKRWLLNSEINDKMNLLKRARKEEKKIALQEEVDSLILEVETLRNDVIEPIELELRKLKISMSKSVTELEI